MISAVEFSLADLSDVSGIMEFMDEHWRKNHILSSSRKLLLHEFQEGNQLNIGLVKNKKGIILGLFGVIKYNSCKLPDIAGSLWKITDSAQKLYPMLGILLRNYVLKKIPHRFFAAPGAGLQTKPIYQLIKMNWNRMEHWYWVNPEVKATKISVNTLNFPKFQESLAGDNLILRYDMKKVTSLEEIRSFDFLQMTDYVPMKDFFYLKKRFFDYPYYRYDVWALSENDSVLAIIVCRRVKIDDCSVYRIVDFLGKETYLPQMMARLKQEVIIEGDEYLDFISYGIPKEIFYQINLIQLNLDSDEVIVPNFFEPLVRKNTPVYCVSDQTNLIFRQFKADGDQDRPNYTN